MDEDKDQKPSEWISNNAQIYTAEIANGKSLTDDELEMIEVQELITGIIQCLDEIHEKLK